MRVNHGWLAVDLPTKHIIVGGVIMSEIMLDSASLYEILTLLRKDKIDYASKWTIKSSFLATSLLVTCPHFKLPPSPAGLNKSKGEYELLLRSLSNIVSVANISGNVLCSTDLLNKTNEFIVSQKKRLKKVLQEKKQIDFHDLETNPIYQQGYQSIVNFAEDFSTPEVQLWIEEGVNYRWQKDFIRKNGIFDRDIIPAIAIFTGMTVKELSLLWTFCNRKSVLDDIIQHTDSDEYKMITNAYLAAAIIRGIYHDYVAKYISNQIYHHPLRKGYLPEDSLDKNSILNVEFPLSFKLYILLILSCSFQEKQLRSRIDTFVHNVSLSREAYAKEIICFNEHNFYDAAIDEAIRNARIAKIRAYPKYSDSLINFLIILATTLLGSFLLNGWEGTVLGLGTSAPTILKIDLGEKIAQASFSSVKKLEKLIHADGGRIDCTNINQVIM